MRTFTITAKQKMFNNQYIKIYGASIHHLKEIDVNIPKNSITVITGPSGSGKSSLAFDTLYAEGQRRYVESLSAYIRQFLDKMPAPPVRAIENLPPAIAVEQKTAVKSTFSTVGTITEVYDYLKLLFTRAGRIYSPISGQEVKAHTPEDIVQLIEQYPEGYQIVLIVPVQHTSSDELKTKLKELQLQGYGRILVNNTFQRIEQFLEKPLQNDPQIYLVVDRIVIDPKDSTLYARLKESAISAFEDGGGICMVNILDKQHHVIARFTYNNHLQLDGLTFDRITEHLFTFTNSYGACQTCQGYGHVLGIDHDLVIPDKTLSVWDDAVVCWKGPKLSEWKMFFINNAPKYGFPIHTPIQDLTPEQYQLLWNGNHKDVYGIYDFFQFVESQTYKIQYRVLLSRYRGRTVCPDCHGTRIRKDAHYVKVNGKSIVDLVNMPITDLLEFLNNLQLDEREQKLTERIRQELRNRLSFIVDVGLGYLTLHRSASTLSGGELQRLHLAHAIGNHLRGTLYVLDEPTIGLHPADTQQLIHAIKKLKETGNTIVIVEHDEEVIQQADYIIDLGPGAGHQGGQVMFQGTFQNLIKCSDSLTAKYFRKEINIAVPKKRRNWQYAIQLKGAQQHNLKSIDVTIPLHVFTCITGPSGSGKSTLIDQLLVPLLSQHFGVRNLKPGKYQYFGGHLNKLSGFEYVDQQPIGRSSRSNPATYTKAFDDIRVLFSKQKISKIRGYTPGFFSFNTKGGRCEHCQGEGVIYVDMQFLSSIELICDQCHGKRYNDEALEVTFAGNNIADILEMTVDQAYAFFEMNITKEFQNEIHSVLTKLEALQSVGLGYISLGQSTSTMSGGEIQRLKLATFIQHKNNGKNLLFIFDEPSTGLHYSDIIRLLQTFDKLIQLGHTVLVIEHNMEIIKYADWIIDLGPEGGENGGYLMFQGSPEDMIAHCSSKTASFLKCKLQSYA